MARRKMSSDSPDTSNQTPLTQENSMTVSVTENATESAESADNTESAESADNTEQSNDAASTDQSNDAASTDQSSTDQKESKPAPEPIDLTAFEAAVEAAVAERDTTTGTLHESAIVSVNEAYRELEGLRGKNAGKKSIETSLRNSLRGDDLPLARAYMNLQEELSAGTSSPKEKAERAPVDPAEAASAHLAILTLAYQNVVIPPELDRSDLQDKVNELVASTQEEVTSYLHWYASLESFEGEETDKPIEPDVTVVAKNAAKLALGRSAKAGAPRNSSSTINRSPFTGKRGDIAAHVAEAFASQPSGAFLTVSQIAEFKSNEYTDSDGNFRKPSQGAISARLFPQDEDKSCTLEGITPAEQDGKKGGRKQ